MSGYCDENYDEIYSRLVGGVLVRRQFFELIDDYKELSTEKFPLFDGGSFTGLFSRDPLTEAELDKWTKTGRLPLW